MSKKCNVICVVGPGFPFVDPVNIQDLSPHIGEVNFFSSARIAFEAVRDKKVTAPIGAVIFTDAEIENRTSLDLSKLVDKCGFDAVQSKSEKVFAITTGSIDRFATGEKIHTVNEFIVALESWATTGKIPEATAST